MVIYPKIDWLLSAASGSLRETRWELAKEYCEEVFSSPDSSEGDIRVARWLEFMAEEKIASFFEFVKYYEEKEHKKYNGIGEDFTKFIDKIIKEKNKMVQINNKLVRNLHKGYGGQAQAIYDECCERFDWDRTKRGLFGRQQILYAENATPENYSPWFLPHNSWTETKGGNWFNVIKEETIEEMWIEERYGLHYDKTKRVTFAKTKAGAYVFLGVYEPVEIAQRTLEKNLINRNGQIVKGVGEKVWIKTYRRISDEYGSVNEWKLKKNS